MDIEKFYNKVYDWIITFGPRILIGIVLLIVGFWLINLIVRWSKSGMQKRDFDASLKPFFTSLIAVALRVLLILGVMQVIGVRMTLFAAIIGAFGVAAGLALSGTLQNFASGILILLLKPFSVGDNIITQGLEGTVTSIQIFYTMVRTFDNRSVIVPNSKLSNEVIINISREGNRRLDIEMKFGNAIDIQQVKSVINAAIDKSEHILKNPERRIGVAVLEENGYKLGINVWVDAHGFQDTKLALQETILEDLKASGIKLAGL
ncbi:mechanosensitive ion channel family protein [Mucilaginibacter hurinus]|uniref:Mechanosensitive ion channel family protein n=1 Tax=Mucilaginibacter hurinus TaxID=2201324 RepID=A0A367GQY7_9SPHI|nr:mechanosensitive ion channel family protein [Mucilaginibacter hurinus]RCH55101.1 mechanosensitive ion channel family protein [Mucilaginibacter hurinus]